MCSELNANFGRGVATPPPRADCAALTGWERAVAGDIRCPPVFVAMLCLFAVFRLGIDAIHRPPRYPALDAYEAAVKLWDQREQERQQAERERREEERKATKAYWASLPPDGPRFERELKHLYEQLDYMVTTTTLSCA